MEIIAYVYSDFPEKFGIPRQSGLIEDTRAVIVFEPAYQQVEALRGIETYSHLWLLWQFSETMRDTWSPTVRPPRLGGNTRMGVFATRSPFRPNPIGLSSVKLLNVELHTPRGPLLHIAGADLMNGTPLYDIKPYLAFTDSHPDARGGFADAVYDQALAVQLPVVLPENMTAEQATAIRKILEQDPRPSYQEDAARVYFLKYAQWDIAFRVERQTAIVEQISESRE